MGIFGINNAAAQKMYSANQHTFVAMQHLVMAMEDCAKNLGKKSWFGKDKGVDAFINFKSLLGRSIVAMSLDGIISEATSNEDVSGKLQVVLTQFQEAFPRWVTAYQFAEYFFDNQEVSLAAIAQVRGTHYSN